MYDFEPETVEKFLKEWGVKKAAVHLPPGLRPYLDEIKEIFSGGDSEALFLATSCYGSCDIADGRAEDLDCDALIHYGHADMGIPTSLPTLYVEARMKIEPFEALKKALPLLKDSCWGLTTTVQHIDYLEEVRKFLEGRKIKSIIGDPGPRSKYPGQILGCDWGSARSVTDEVDGFLYIGTGRFHPVGVSLATDKNVVIVNPVAGSYEKVEPMLSKFLDKRGAMVSGASLSEKFGVLASTKQGQNRLDLAESMAKKLEKRDYDSRLLVADEIDPTILKDYRLESFVNTACPRIPIDDSKLYDNPILTPFEAEVLLGEQDWDPYQLDEIGINWGE